MQGLSSDARPIPAAHFHGAISALATTAQALLSSCAQQGQEELAAMLGLQRVLEVASCVLEAVNLHSTRRRSW